MFANFVSSDGPVSIRTGRKGSNGGGAGEWIEVHVRVGGTQVGTVFFEHLNL